jgi:hypothetical protein
MKIINKGSATPGRRHNQYLLMSISLIVLLPVLSSFLEHCAEDAAYSWHLIAKWLIFWGAGIRLFITGLRQAATPEYSAVTTSKLTPTERFTLIRRLGFANISLGITAILSIINDSWRMLAAIATSIYFGFAAIQHGACKHCNANEKLAFWYDTVMACCVVVYLFWQ